MKWLSILIVVLLALPIAAQDESPTPDIGLPTVPTQTPSPTLTPAGTLTPTTTSTITPTLQPEVSPIIVSWSDEMIYPQGMAFVLFIDRPLEQIEQLTLTIQAGEQEPRVIEFDDLRPFIQSGPNRSLLLYTWEIPASNPVPFLSDIRYTFDVVTTRGEVAEVPGIRAYRDPDIDWIRAEDAEEVISFIYPDGIINPVPLRLALYDVYRALEDHTGVEGPHYRFALYNDSATYDNCVDGVVKGETRTDLACNPAIINQSLREAGFTRLEALADTGLGLQQQLVRLMVADFYDTIWDDAPEWLQIGLTYLHFPGPKTYIMDLLRGVGRNRTLFTLEGMHTPPDPDSPDYPIWEAQSYAMVLYIAHERGIPAVLELAEDFDSYDDVEAIIPQLNQWLYSDVAATEFGISLYQPATPIPSPTRTVTPFPPSATPTSTFTPTPTPTPTVTGFLTFTPLPTTTPSITPTERPPSVTPLPPGWRPSPTPTTIPTPTALPAVSASDDGEGIDSTALTAAIALGVIVLAALFTLFYRMRQTREYHA